LGDVGRVVGDVVLEEGHGELRVVGVRFPPEVGEFVALDAPDVVDDRQVCVSNVSVLRGVHVDNGEHLVDGEIREELSELDGEVTPLGGEDGQGVVDVLERGAEEEVFWHLNDVRVSGRVGLLLDGEHLGDDDVVVLEDVHEADVWREGRDGVECGEVVRAVASDVDGLELVVEGLDVMSDLWVSRITPVSFHDLAKLFHVFGVVVELCRELSDALRLVSQSTVLFDKAHGADAALEPVGDAVSVGDVPVPGCDDGGVVQVSVGSVSRGEVFLSREPKVLDIGGRRVFREIVDGRFREVVPAHLPEDVAAACGGVEERVWDAVVVDDGDGGCWDRRGDAAHLAEYERGRDVWNWSDDGHHVCGGSARDNRRGGCRETRALHGGERGEC